MAESRMVRALVFAAVAFAASSAARAEEQLRLDFAQQPAPASPGGVIASLFAPRAAAAAVSEPVSPLDIRPTIVSPPVAGKAESRPKPSDIPAPPRPEREVASAATPAVAQPAQATQAAAVRGLPTPSTTAATRVAPAPAGFFGWLASLNTDAAPQEPQRVASLGGAGRTNLDLSNPFRPRALPGDDPRDDDFEDEMSSKKLVEKQTDYVNIACLKPSLMRLINAAGTHFKGTPVITSGFRDRGRRGSYHRRCEAADFFITGVSSGALTTFLRTLPGAGGVGTYCHTKSVHIDTGEPRDWHQCGFRRRFALREPSLTQTARR
jgi:hypothetical protein